MRRLSEQQQHAHTADTVVRLCAQGQLGAAVEALEDMDHEGIWTLGTDTYRTLLLECMKKRALAEGKRVHHHIRKAGLLSDFHLGVVIVRMYCACGKMGLARSALDKARSYGDDQVKQNVFIWTVLIRGYVRLGHMAEALRAFREMVKEGVKPDKFVLVTALNACTSMADLDKGVELHEEAVRSGLGADPFVNNALVEMYGKCGSSRSARTVFDQLEKRNVVSWNALIAGYVQNGHAATALVLFQKMRQQDPDLKPDRSTFVPVLKACAQLADLERGIQVHALITASGFTDDLHLGAALVDMYAGCGSIQDALALFQGMPRKNLSLWTSMIKATAHSGLHRDTITLFKQMQADQEPATTETTLCALAACSSLRDLASGRDVHDLVLKSGCAVTAETWTALISMYSQCGCVKSALDTFYKVPSKTLAEWNSAMEACNRHGQSKEALKLYQHLLQAREHRPDVETFVHGLDACAGIEAPERGRRVYARAVKRGVGQHLSLVAAAVDMYVRCGCTADAVQVLSTVSSSRPEGTCWASFLSGHPSHRELCSKTVQFLHEVSRGRVAHEAPDAEAVTTTTVVPS